MNLGNYSYFIFFDIIVKDFPGRTKNMLNAINRTKDIHEFTTEKARLQPVKNIRNTSLAAFYKPYLELKKAPGSKIMINRRLFLRAVGIVTVVILALLAYGLQSLCITFADLKVLAVSQGEVNASALTPLFFQSESIEARENAAAPLSQLNPHNASAPALNNADKMRCCYTEGSYNKALQLFIASIQAAPPDAEEYHLAALIYLQLRDYKKSHECMLTAIDTCTDPERLAIYADSYAQIFEVDYGMLESARVDSSRLDKNALLYRSFEEAVELKKLSLQ